MKSAPRSVPSAQAKSERAQGALPRDSMENISIGLLFEVLRARLTTGADIVVKRPVPAHADSVRVLALLAREAEAGAALGGMGAPFMLGWDPESGELSRSWVPGKTLAELRAEMGAAGAPFATVVLCKLLLVLSRAHAAGWLVVDLSPSNVLLTPTGELVILDFGSARRVSSAPAKAPGELDPVSPGFASPEQVAGLALNTASDVYAAARLVQWLVTGESGRTPHPTLSGSDMSSAMAGALLRRGDIGAQSLVRRSLSRSEQGRPVDLQAEVRACRRGLELRGVHDWGSYLSESGRNWGRSWVSGPLLYCALVAFVVAGGVAVFLVRPRPVASSNSVESAWIDVSASPWASCTVDGVEPTVTPAGAPWRVSPGEHNVRCEHPSARFEEQRISARRGERSHVYLRMNVPEQDALSPEALTSAYLREAMP